MEPGAREREVVTGKGGYGGVATLHPRATEDPMTDDRMALVDPLQSGPAATPRLAFLLGTIEQHQPGTPHMSRAGWRRSDYWS